MSKDRVMNLNEEYARVRKQILNFIKPDFVENMFEVNIFSDEMDALLLFVDQLYAQQNDEDAYEKLEFFTNLLMVTCQMFRNDQNEIEINSSIDAHRRLMLEMDSAWYGDEIRRLMHIIMDEEFQKIMMANIQFNRALQKSDIFVKIEGCKLLEAIGEFKKKYPQDQATVLNVLRYSAALIDEPDEHIETYQRYAHTVEGKPSRAYQILGQAMKVFGAGLYVCGLTTMIAGVASLFPSVFLSGAFVLAGFGAIMIGFGSWAKGNDYVERGRIKGLSEKMGFFAQSVGKTQPGLEKRRGKGKEKAEDDIPLHRLRHHEGRSGFQY